jgi:hypothetical protein
MDQLNISVKHILANGKEIRKHDIDSRIHRFPVDTHKQVSNLISALSNQYPAGKKITISVHEDGKIEASV